MDKQSALRKIRCPHCTFPIIDHEPNTAEDAKIQHRIICRLRIEIKRKRYTTYYKAEGV